MLLTPPPAHHIPVTFIRLQGVKEIRAFTEIRKLLFLESSPWKSLQHLLKFSPSLKKGRSKNRGIKKGKLNSSKQPTGNAPLLSRAAAETEQEFWRLRDGIPSVLSIPGTHSFLQICPDPPSRPATSQRNLCPTATGQSERAQTRREARVGPWGTRNSLRERGITLGENGTDQKSGGDNVGTQN